MAKRRVSSLEAFSAENHPLLLCSLRCISRNQLEAEQINREKLETLTMAFEVPLDLINQVQILVRNEANLSDYDPDDPSLLHLPSLGESIAELDPSPPYLRCKHCKGRLLRGLQSLFCVFCGRDRAEEVPPEPINFRSTSGYRWFLQSLDLDGSETVRPSVEPNESNKGQKAPQDEFPLSDLLNLEIKWHAAAEKVETCRLDETPTQRSSLNLAGVNLDDFFPERKGDAVSDAPEKQVAASKTVEDTGRNALHAQGNFSLFENVQPSETAVSLKEDELGDSSSGWEAEFQSAATLGEDSKPFDPFVASSVNISTHMDTVFGLRKDPLDGNTKDDTVSSATNTSDDCFEGDPWSNSNSSVNHQPKQFEVSKNLNDGGISENLNSSTTVDWFEEDMWQSGRDKAPGGKVIHKGEDSFDAWNDFTSSTGAQGFTDSSLKQTVNLAEPFVEQTSDTNLFGSINSPKDMDLGGFSQPDLFSGAFSNQNDSAHVNDIWSEASVSNRMDNIDAQDGGGNELPTVGDVSDANAVSKDDDVEMLMSQMHDLSFMLETNLSVPPRQDSLS